MNDEADNPESYRASHASPEYGQIYSKTYEHGFYHDQWTKLERPILSAVISEQLEAGRESCLDFACGTGRITSLLESILPAVSGVDVSDSMLAEARSNCGKATFYHQDITSQPLDRHYDLVTAFRFFLNAEACLRTDALLAIHKCLQDDGRLVTNIHVNSASPLGLAYRLRNKLAGRTKANILSHEEMIDLLNAAGFLPERVIWYSYLPRMGWRMPWLSKYLMRPVERFCNWFPLIPNRSAQCFMLIAKKKNAAA